MSNPAGHSPETRTAPAADLAPLRRLLVGHGWPWVIVWVVTRAWMFSLWASQYRYIANDVNYYFTELGQSGGYQVVLREYPLPVVWFLDLLRRPVAGDVNLYLVLFALSMAVLDAGFSLWLWQRHSRVASIYWMAYVFVMGPLVWFRYDLLAGVVVGAAAFLVARRPSLSGALVALGAALKLWPALLLAALVGRGRSARSRLLAFAGTGVGFALVSLVWAGPTRLVSPLAWQKDRGLQIESVWASLPMWHFHHDVSLDPLTTYRVEMSQFHAYEVYGPRVGLLLTLASAAMAVGVLFAVVVALMCWRCGHVEPGTRALAMVAIVLFMLVGNKTLSPQYMAWLGAVVAARIGLAPRGRERVRASLLAVGALLLAALTAYIYPGHYGELLGSGPGADAAVLALVVRNLGLLVMCLLAALWTVDALRAPRRFAPPTVETDTIIER